MKVEGCRLRISQDSGCDASPGGIVIRIFWPRTSGFLQPFEGLVYICKNDAFSFLWGQRDDMQKCWRMDIG